VTPSPSLSPPRSADPQPKYQPGAPAVPSGAVEIKSAEVSALTSAGLGELKRLINEAAVKRRELSAQVEAVRRKLEQATKRLEFARTFIVRLFTRKSVPRLAQGVETAREQLDATTAELAGCFIEVDFAFDQATLDSYAALVRTFEAVSSCQCIWDVTALQATDRLRDRTLATTSYSRTPVAFDFAVPEIVKSAHRAMRLGNATGPQIYFYPGFLMMRDTSSDFALIEYQELAASFSESHFIEAETVPSDTQVIGQTWAKTNKDGSPDRRFKDNYSIPIVRYAEMLFESPAGLREAYQFSDFDRASAFHQSLSNHQRALIELARAENAPASPVEASEPENEVANEDLDTSSRTIKPETFVLDWIVLGMVVLVLALGINSALSQHPDLGQRPSGAVADAPITPAAPPKTDRD
jgi:hypothetical protein